MGHRKRSAPRRGSLGFRPRKRASSIVPRIRSWPHVSDMPVRPLGFLGYKVGMTHVYMIDDRPESPTEGKEIFVPVTLLETPPMLLAGVRLYSFDPNRGLYTYTEMWADEKLLREHYIDRLIKRFNPKPERRDKTRVEDIAEKAAELRVMMVSQPRLAGGISKKVPELLEVPLSGASIDDKAKYAMDHLGKQVRISDVFTAGTFIDVIGVTKGKGFQGPVKRFGVKELPRWHKHRKASRTVASRGSRVGALSSTPQAGQMGYHQRVDYNKRILLIGTVSKEKELLEKINPASGWHKYGLIKNDFIMLSGSIPGSRKRPIVMRYPVRNSPWTPKGAPKITYIHMPS
jgi:large subunit ribosomal protein L3